MSIGAMKDRIELLNSIKNVNSYGEETISWASLATVWAEIKEKPGTAYLAGPLPATHKKVIFLIHPIIGPKRGTRVLWQTMTFKIEDIINQPDGRMALHALEEDS